jgi:outer membrane protein assembly factor BamB
MPSPCRPRVSSRKIIAAVAAILAVEFLGFGNVSPTAWGVVTFIEIPSDSWPRFRGPNGQGVSTETVGLPTTWTAEDALWKIKLPGSGHSSPVVWGDRVFITAANESDGKGFLVAYLTSNGRQLWRCEFDLPKYRMNALNAAAASTPAVDADRVVVCWATPSNMQLAAFDHTGNSLWSRDFGPTNTRHGPTISPILVGGLVVFAQEQEQLSATVATESRWIGVDAATGETKWTCKRDHSGSNSYSTPCVLEQGRRTLAVFTSLAHGITAVDIADGKVAWEVSDALNARVCASPVLAGGLVIGTCGEGGRGLRMTAVRPPKTADEKPQVAYTLEDSSVTYVPTPVAYRNWLFTVHDGGQIACRNAADGKILWAEKPGGKFYGSPVIADGKIYVITTEGTVVVLAASDKYELLATNPLSEKSHSTPAISGGKLFLRTFTHLFCVKGRNVIAIPEGGIETKPDVKTPD